MLHYGSETWTLIKAIQNKLEASEMWIYRRMVRISWTEHKSNEQVLEMTFSKRSLIVTIKKMPVFQTFNQDKMVYKDYYLEGKIEGKRGHGRPTMM